MYQQQYQQQPYQPQQQPPYQPQYGGQQMQRPHDPNRCSRKQATVLADFGYNPDHFNFQQATEIMDQLKRNNWNPLPGGPAPNPNRRRGGGGGSRGNYNNGGGGQRQMDPNAPCTPGQRNVLMKYGYDLNMSAGMASDIISALKANNWQPLDPNQPVPQQPPQGGGYAPQGQPQHPAPSQGYSQPNPTYGPPQTQPQYPQQPPQQPTQGYTQQQVGQADPNSPIPW